MDLPTRSESDVSRPPPSVQVRWARPSDAMAIARIDEAAAGRDPDRIRPPLRPHDRPALHTALATVAGRVVGYGHLEHGPIADGWPAGACLSAVAVDPDWRGHGVDHALLAARLARLDADGPTAAYYVTSATHPVSVELHERFGFVSKGEVTTPDGRCVLLERPPGG